MIDINPKDALAEIKSGKAMMIDVRTIKEHFEVRVPFSLLASNQSLVENFKYFKPLFEKKIILYCRSGVRSKAIADQINEMNEGICAYNLHGGILNWMREGLDSEEL